MKGQAAIVELKKSGKNKVYRYKNKTIILTNHWIADDNPDEYDDGDSQSRKNDLFQNAY